MKAASAGISGPTGAFNDDEAVAFNGQVQIESNDVDDDPFVFVVAAQVSHFIAGGTGKSQLLSVIRRVFGAIHRSAPFSTFHRVVAASGRL